MRLTQPLKIALYDASSSGGVCHYTHQLAEILAELGHEVTLLTNEGYELDHLNKHFKTHFLFKPSFVGACARAFIPWDEPRTSDGQRGVSGTSHLTRWVANGSSLKVFQLSRLFITFIKGAMFLSWNRPHIIHFQWLVNHRYDYYLARTLKTLGFTTVYTAHDLLPREKNTLSEQAARRKVYQTVDRIIVHSNGNKAELEEVLGISAEKIFVIPHGSNGLFYKNGESDREAIRQQLGIESHQRVILFFGIIRRYKGLEYLAEAFTEVRARVPTARLLIVGAVHKGDPESYQHYSRLLQELRRHESVRCVTDYIPVEKVSSYFAASDLVVLPYVKTYTSGVLLTAFAAGKPVVVTDTGALKEVVEDGKSGYVVPPKDAKSLAKVIIRVLASPDRLELMGRYAKQAAETRYSWQTVAAETVTVYRSALQEASRRGIRMKICLCRDRR